MFSFSIIVTALATFMVMPRISLTQECETGWSSYNQSCYLVTNEEKNWEDNRIICKELNANLTSIHSDSENEFVAALCKPHHEYCFIGLRKQDDVANFSWIDGSDLKYQSSWKKKDKELRPTKNYVVSIEAISATWLKTKQNRSEDKDLRYAVCKKAAKMVMLSTVVVTEEVTEVKTSIIYEYEMTSSGADERPQTKVKTLPSSTARKNYNTLPTGYTLADLLESGSNGQPRLNMFVLVTSADSIDQSILEGIPPGETESRKNLPYMDIEVVSINGTLLEDRPIGSSLTTSISVLNCSNCRAVVLSHHLDIIQNTTGHTLPRVADGKFEMVGRFISISVYNSNSTKAQTPNISFTVHKVIGGKINHARCVFIDQNKNMNWSTDGCKTKILSNGGIKCFCNHLTSFGILLQISSTDKTETDKVVLDAITYVSLGISLISLLLLLPVYCFFRDLWKSTRVFIHTNLVLNLIVTYVLFLGGIDSGTIEVCRFVGVALHFTVLSVFMWMMAEAVFIALKVTKTNSTRQNIPRNYFIICYGVSVLIVGITIAVNINNYNTRAPCWLSQGSTGAIYAIIIPALIIIMLDMGIMVMTLRIIYRKSKSRQPRSEKKYNARILKTVKATLFLLPVFGITWVFGPLAFSKKTIAFEYIFVILNGVQGLAIFIIYCLLDVEVREQFNTWRARKKRQRDAKSITSQPRGISLRNGSPSGSLHEEDNLTQHLASTT